LISLSSVRSVAALLGLILVAGCALSKPNSEVSVLPDRPVDGRFYLTWIDHGDGLFGLYRVWTFIQVFEDSGRVAICGAYVADLEPERAGKLNASFAADRSYVDLNGLDFSRPGLRINPGFMKYFRRGGEDHRELIRGVSAGCVRTDKPWDSTFEQPKLALNIRMNP
jgi:hypothetical protein